MKGGVYRMLTQYIQQVIVVFFGDFLERFGQGLIV